MSFKKDQKVYCAVYGEGVVTDVFERTQYPVYVKFQSINERVVRYTADGKVRPQCNATLFPHPVEIVTAAIKPSIDWNHVSENFKWLAMDADGKFHVYTSKPLQGNQQWTTNLPCTPAIHFASFTPGTCNWKDSLVERPN